MLRVADMMMRCPYLPLPSYLSAISLLDSVMPIGLHNQLAILTSGAAKAYTAAVVTACKRTDMMVSILMKMGFNDKGGSSSSMCGHEQRDQACKTNKSSQSTTTASNSTASSTKKKASKKSSSSKMRETSIDPASLTPEGWPAWLWAQMDADPSLAVAATLNSLTMLSTRGASILCRYVLSWTANSVSPAQQIGEVGEPVSVGVTALVRG